MLKNIFLTVMLVFFVMPFASNASDKPLVETTEVGSYQLTSYYDLRSRESLVQVSNISNQPVAIHVQIFQNDVAGCPERNFYDTLTGNDTHVYNLRDLQGNGAPVNIALADDSHGFVVITEVENANIGASSISTNNLIGNFRIIDSAGYEYRTNSSGTASNANFSESRAIRYTFNFNQLGNTNLSDVVAIAFDDGGTGETGVDERSVTFAANIYNDAENPTSCDLVEFACGAPTDILNQGINDLFLNTNGDNLICPGNNTSDGFVELIVVNNFQTGQEALIGFAGLNNGNGRGSMDSMVANNENDLGRFIDFPDDIDNN